LKLRLFAVAACILLLALPAARAQHEHDMHAAAPATLRTDLGSLHHPISTTSEEAQKFFDQGLTLVYAFNHHQGVLSFQRAAELDPKSPMPYWGIALALGPNYNETEGEDEKGAYQAIQKAKQLTAGAPPAEKQYVDALALRFSNDDKPDFDKLGRAYAAAMRDLCRSYPDDPDACTLFAESLMDLHAWALWTHDGKPGENTLEITSTLETVLRKWPDHAGANHFYIHAMEMAPDPERALPSADRLAALVPGAGHLVHMPSHIYIRTGDYAAAVKTNQAAIAVDNKTPSPVPNVNYTMYRSHNVHFLAAAAMMDGEYDVALSASKDLDARANRMIPDMPMAEAFKPYQLFVQLRFGHWDDVLAAPPAPENLKGLALFTHYARGVAFAAKGNAAQAEAERSAMESFYKQIPPGPAFGMTYNDWSTLHDLAAHTLNARIAAARQDSAAAIQEWRAAVDVQDHMNYDEPADWYYPVRESLGAALLAGGDAAAAEKVFREDLDGDNRRNPRSLFGLWSALQAQHKDADAQWVKSAFQSAWKGSPDALRLADF